VAVIRYIAVLDSSLDGFDQIVLTSTVNWGDLILKVNEFIFQNVPQSQRLLWYREYRKNEVPSIRANIDVFNAQDALLAESIWITLSFEERR
jgi:hypothetical protein